MFLRVEYPHFQRDVEEGSRITKALNLVKVTFSER